MSVFQVHDEANENDIEQRSHIANVIFILIPKIVRTLTNIATGDKTISDSLKVVMLGEIYCIIRS